MTDYLTASRTKDHFHAQLLREHPEIVSIAPQIKLDDAGHPTQEGVIVIGVAPRNPLHAGIGSVYLTARRVDPVQAASRG